MKTYRFISDPGHGWLEVPLADLQELGIAHKISPYSYYDTATGFAYLEEDLDASTMYQHCQRVGRPYEYESVYDENTFIRGLNQYPSPHDWRTHAYGEAASG